MRPAVFLDRDGTVIELVHHLNDPAQVQLIPSAGEAIALLRAAGWPVIIVTNQSVVGRGKLTEAGLAEVHTEMRRHLAMQGADVDGIYYSTFVPKQKDPTIIEDQMRKPGPGMLLQAAREMELELTRSWMVGDTVSDMLAGCHAGCHTALVRTGYGAEYCHDLAQVTRDTRDLGHAAREILMLGGT